MKKRWMQRASGFLLMLVCLLLVTGVPVRAALASDETQVRKQMNTAFASNAQEVVVTLDRTFAVEEAAAKSEAESYAEELLVLLEEVALDNGRLMRGTSYSYTIADRQHITYTFDISSQFTKKVTVLKSEKDAYKKALKALKKRDYTTNFYADSAMYYEIFVLALQHHPEFNYNVVIWKSTDGTCGYRPGKELTSKKIASKINQTDKKADAVIKKIITKTMTRKQKLKAIHDYIVKNCVYDETVDTQNYNDAYTAYGCLVKKKAVCQGYAAAFNLLAQKAGISSIAVPGEAGGGSHAWNYVKDGSNYRYIDTTWDDPLPDGGSKASVKQTYFYRTQAQLEKTHTWDKVENAKKYVTYAAVLL